MLYDFHDFSRYCNVEGLMAVIGTPSVFPEALSDSASNVVEYDVGRRAVRCCQLIDEMMCKPPLICAWATASETLLLLLFYCQRGANYSTSTSLHFPHVSLYSTLFKSTASIGVLLIASIWQETFRAAYLSVQEFLAYHIVHLRLCFRPIQNICCRCLSSPLRR